MNISVKNMPRANQEVFQALVNGGMARQNRSGLAEVEQVQGQLEQHDHDPTEQRSPPTVHEERDQE